MNIIRTIFLASTFAFAGSVCAQDCSGGTEGGMDATGNQCSQPERANPHQHISARCIGIRSLIT